MVPPMPPDFEELDYQETPLGTLILRRRRQRSLDDLEVYEIILGEGYLMSSLFTTVEIALADLALARLPAGKTNLSRGAWQSSKYSVSIATVSFS